MKLAISIAVPIQLSDPKTTLHRRILARVPSKQRRGNGASMVKQTFFDFYQLVALIKMRPTQMASMPNLLTQMALNALKAKKRLYKCYYLEHYQASMLARATKITGVLSRVSLKLAL